MIEILPFDYNEKTKPEGKHRIVRERRTSQKKP